MKINPKKTALVIIDLQNGVVKMPTEPHSTETVISNSVKLAEKFKAMDLPIFLVRVEFSPDRKDALNNENDEPTKFDSSSLPENWSEIIPELSELSDQVITKKQWGAFTGTDLDLQLRRRGIDTIILCGIATTFGVESTARFAYEYNYKQIFAEDAMSSMTKSQHDNSISVFKRMGLVRSTSEILESLNPEKS